MELDNTTPVPAPTAEPSQPAEVSQEKLGTPQDQNRREVYAKLYGGQQPAPSAPTEQTPEPVAQTEQTQQEPEPQDVTPPPDAGETRLAKMEEAITQISTFLSQLTQPSAPQQPSQPPAAPAVKQPGAWLEALRQGDVAKFEELLADTIAEKFVPRTKSEATTEALDMFRIETELTSYVDDLRRKNPDLMPLEDTIAAKAKVRLEAVQAAGKVRSADEYIKAYKNAVTESVGEARKIIQTIRAAGKEDATVRNREVLSSSPVAPNAVSQGEKGVVTKPQTNVPETTEDYIARRRASQTRSAGLAGF